MVPLAVVFGAWVTFTNISSSIHRQIQQHTAFQHWRHTTHCRARLRASWLAWSSTVHQITTTTTTLTALTALTTTTTTTPVTTSFQLKSTCFSLWQAYTTQESLLREVLCATLLKIKIQHFVLWSNWTNQTQTRRQQHARALKTTLQKHQRRTFSQWRLSTQLSLLQQQQQQQQQHSNSGNDTTAPTIKRPLRDAWDDINTARIEIQRTATQALIPALQRLCLQLHWSTWLHAVFLSCRILPHTRHMKFQCLQTIPKRYKQWQQGCLRLKRRMYQQWKQLPILHRCAALAFCVRTVGRRAFDCWLFVHVQRRKAKTIQSPTKGYKSIQRRQLLSLHHTNRRRLHLPHRGKPRERASFTKEEAVVVLLAERSSEEVGSSWKDDNGKLKNYTLIESKKIQLEKLTG